MNRVRWGHKEGVQYPVDNGNILGPRHNSSWVCTWTFHLLFFERFSAYSGESVWRSVPVSGVYLCLFTLFILILWVHHFIMVSECFVVLCFIGDECFFYFFLILFLFVYIFFMDWCFLFCFYFFLLLCVWCDVGCVRKLLCRSIGGK